MRLRSWLVAFLRTHPPRQSRWPLALLAACAMAVFLAPLAFELFMAVPWPVRQRLGQLIVLALVALGVRRLLAVRPGDLRPAARDPGSTPRDDACWLAWALQLAVATLALPLLAHPESIGFGDWDHHLQKFEAIRRTVLVWHQFPWWTPWVRGGFPLASEPECGVFSLATPLVLALGTGTGLRLGTVLCLMVAVEGARRVGRYWLGDPWGAAAVGVLYGINGGVLVYTVAGHFIPMSYCALPWLVLYTQRVGEGIGCGLWLGFWTAFDLLNGIQYPSMYALAIAAAVWLRALALQPRDRRWGLIVNSVAAAGVCVALAGWRIATTALVLRDYPRIYSSMFGGSPIAVLHWLLDRPGANVLARSSLPQFWESTCYIGPLALLLVLMSLRGGWRWWHVLTALCLWLAMGAHHWTQPSFWLAAAPVFQTMHVISRWRIPAMLGVGLAAGAVVARWRCAGGVRRILAPCLVLALAADYLAYGYTILPVATSIEPRDELFPGPATPALVNVESNLAFPAILRGYGVIRAHEPLLGYDRTLPTARLWRGHPRYVGEAWTGERAVTPTSWSPSRIVFQVAPGQDVAINQNPGSWWLVNGRRAFTHWRCAEWTRPFSARADATGRLELQIAPKGASLGLALHLAGVATTALALAVSARLRRAHEATPALSPGSTVLRGDATPSSGTS